ncbi:hypothetical protein [Pseudomonas sp. CFBP 13719]|uniref:hypothetical protein n=1 Tax=Pseudomonas sp. CFBP 13719 TaxID=2775303 RepID=UPI001FD0E898|nr:hypothetical protein [Pseudomonas sp. CFBP 13719]
MELRPDLMPPMLDESLVARLTNLSEQIDCGHPDQTREQLVAFNREAMTEFEFIDFQEVYDAQTHDTWVRKVLAIPYEQRVTDVTKQELIERARRVMECDGAEHHIDFWLHMLEIALEMPNGLHQRKGIYEDRPTQGRSHRKTSSQLSLALRNYRLLIGVRC